MREKELRLALVCYGGISLAVYMHGITKEIWRLASASQAHHRPGAGTDGTACVYRRLLRMIADECGIDLRVIVDILAGASAGGINAIFLAEAISSGASLDPLTDLWLETADVDKLVDPEVSAVSRFAKAAAVPFAWMLSAKRGGAVERTVEADHRAEVRGKLANFVRARWFDPPFGGRIFTDLLLDAFKAMSAEPKGPPLLPDYQPLDLFVTVTDFHGYPQRLRLHSPAEVVEREHRITLAFRDEGGASRRLADMAELVFAARATASFPGAFPPFQVSELDKALADRDHPWPGRLNFLKRVLPRHVAIGDIDAATLIDGSVLANAPFRPALAALDDRPVRREVDRRFVYIDPTPGHKSIRMGNGGDNGAEKPGFFATIFGAMSDIPREQPIRDNLEAIDQRSSRIRRMTRIVISMRPEVEAAIERTFGLTLLLTRPTPARLAAWRFKANTIAARDAGFTYPAYGHLKLSVVVEDMAHLIFRLGEGDGRQRYEEVRQAIWRVVRAQGLDADDAMTSKGARADVIDFMRHYDLSFRTRRLRFLARRLNEIDETVELPREAANKVREVVYRLIGRYRHLSASTEEEKAVFASVTENAEAAMAALGARMDLQALDNEADEVLAEALASLPTPERRAMILAYLGFPFYDVATLPLLQGEGLDEFDPVKVDRISPDDATAIREGGAEATLKGIQFHNFGAFFSRAYRENDYIWGRLHGADRLIDIVISTLPAGKRLPAGAAATLKKEAFAAIIADERGRCLSAQSLLDELEREIGTPPSEPQAGSSRVD
ncbi:patatin-like protein [Allosphingosinicella vermicomposti]|uniref:patatin-like protein n=1 Tax=Allosphingosinicella vermicomposti TaxID=614671 RepID=UPI000D0EEA6A|nr:patatin-like protein [Allosphingosinicella vermicomposti]